MVLYQVFCEDNNQPRYISISRNKCSNFIIDNINPFNPEEFHIESFDLTDLAFKDTKFTDDTKECDYNYLFPFHVKYNNYFNRLEIDFGEKLYKTKLHPGAKGLKFPLTWTRLNKECARIPGYYVVSKESFKTSTTSDIEHEVENIVSNYVLLEYMKEIKSVMSTDMNFTYRKHITITNNY